MNTQCRQRDLGEQRHGASEFTVFGGMLSGSGQLEKWRQEALRGLVREEKQRWARKEGWGQVVNGCEYS